VVSPYSVGSMRKMKKIKNLQMSDIAEIAGVSKSTVSRALADSPLVNEKTKNIIKSIASEHNYRVNVAARNFRVKESLRVAVLLPAADDADWSTSDPFFLELIADLAVALDDHGHQLLLTRTTPQPVEWIEDFVHSHQADGVILIGQGSQHAAINRLAERYRAVSVWGTKMDEDQAYPVVGTDNVLGGERATQHLLETGRRRIVFLGHKETPEVEQRLAGYRRAHAEAGVDVDHALVPDYPESQGDAHQAIEALVDSKTPFDAVFAISDSIAIRVIRWLHGRGIKVPDDVAVVGYDDIQLASYVTPSLTTIRQNRSVGAKILVDNLLEALDGHNPEKIVLDPQLIIRESSQPSGDSHSQ